MKELYRNLGIEFPIEIEREKFVNRIESTLFKIVEDEGYEFVEECLFKICYHLGLSEDRIVEGNSYFKQKVYSLTLGEFGSTLVAIKCIHDNFEKKYNGSGGLFCGSIITDAINESTVDLGIRWEADMFYKSGNEFLDKELIRYVIEELRHFHQEHEDLKLAIKCFIEKEGRGVTENCFKMIEGVTRKILNNSKTLDNNKVELLKYLDLHQSWNGILSNFIKYMHDFRHASAERHNIREEEMESSLYLSCLLVRLIIKKHKLLT